MSLTDREYLIARAVTHGGMTRSQFAAWRTEQGVSEAEVYDVMAKLAHHARRN